MLKSKLKKLTMTAFLAALFCSPAWALATWQEKALEAAALERLFESTPRFQKTASQKRAIKTHKDLIRKLQQVASRQGLFVSIFNRANRKLVGCMGSLYPTRENLLAEVNHWALLAAWQDPRFQGGSKKISIEIIVTLIERVEPVNNFLKLNVIRHGLLVKYHQQEALLLPGEAFTTQYALGMIARKLGKKRFDPNRAELFRIHAHRFGAAKKLFSNTKGFSGYGG